MWSDYQRAATCSVAVLPSFYPVLFYVSYVCVIPYVSRVCVVQLCVSVCVPYPRLIFIGRGALSGTFHSKEGPCDNERQRQCLHVSGVNSFPNHQSVCSISFSPFLVTNSRATNTEWPCIIVIREVERGHS